MKHARPTGLYSGTDWIFAAFVDLEFLAFAVFPALPLVVAGVGTASRIRQSRKQKLTL